MATPLSSLSPAGRASPADDGARAASPPPRQAQSNPNPLDRFIRAVAFLSHLCGIVAALLITAGVVIICQMVIVRYVLNHGTIWQTDFVTHSLIAATLIGSPYVLLTKGHVNVDLVPLHIGPSARFWLALFAALIGLGFCVTLAVLGFELWHEAYVKNWRSDTIWRLRLWIPYSSMPIGMGLVSLQYVADILSLLTGRAAPFGMAPTEPAP